jgi:aminodeoxyfutalosine synthase
MTATLENPGSVPLAAWADDALAPIRHKIDAGQRLTIEDGLILQGTPDIWGVCALADRVRRRLHGRTTYYNINRHLNYSNVCALSCKFCDFYAKKNDPDAYTFSLDKIREETRAAVKSGATEMHVVGGLDPYLPWSYYPDLVRAIHETASAEGSDLHVKAFTAVEIVHLAKIAKRYRASDPAAGIRWVLQRLKEAGLGSLPGGGAEVFDDRVHDEAFKGKIRSDVWLDVHHVAHELGLNTNATMLYGHIEQPRERLVHMDMLRRAQDVALARLGYEGEGIDGDNDAITLTRPEAELPTPDMNDRGGYFQTIIPLPFFPDGSELEHLPGPGGLENLRTLAVARLMLDNFPHVKAFWIMQTLPMAEFMLQSGADDIDGTVVWYDITKVGGSDTHQEVGVAELVKAIRDAGGEPIERDTLYRRVERNGNTWRVAE